MFIRRCWWRPSETLTRDLELIHGENDEKTTGSNSSSRGEAEFLSGKRIYAHREDKFSFYTWVFLTFGEGICGKSPFTKCGSSSQMCVPQTSKFFFNYLFIYFLFYKSIYLKTQHLGFSFKTCILKNVCLDNVGPNNSLFTFWAKNACYVVDMWGQTHSKCQLSLKWVKEKTKN